MSVDLLPGLTAFLRQEVQTTQEQAFDTQRRIAATQLRDEIRARDFRYLTGQPRPAVIRLLQLAGNKIEAAGRTDVTLTVTDPTKARPETPITAKLTWDPTSKHLTAAEAGDWADTSWQWKEVSVELGRSYQKRVTALKFNGPRPDKEVRLVGLTSDRVASAVDEAAVNHLDKKQIGFAELPWRTETRIKIPLIDPPK